MTKPLSELQVLLTELERLDIKLWVEGEKLRFDAPPGALLPELRSRLQAHKSGLIAYLDQAGVHAPADRFPAIDERERAGIFPLSFAQRHFGLLQNRYPQECFYNVPFGFRIEGALNVPALQQTLDVIVERHAFLRTTLQLLDGEYRQVVAATGAVAIRHVDMQSVSADKQAASVEREIWEECQTPFDLARDCTLRVRLLCLSQYQHILLLCLHNTLFDTGSLRALLHEIEQGYAAFAAGQTPQLPVLPMQYSDSVRWQQALLSGDLQARFTYWHHWFAKGEPPALTQAIAGRSEPSVTFRAGTLWCELSAELTAQLKQLSQQAGVTLFITLVSAYALVLQKHSGYDDVVLGTTFANRNHWKLEPLLGSLLNILALRFDLVGNPDFLSILKQAQGAVMAAFAHQDIPFSVMAPLLQPGQQRTQPLFRTVFSFLGELSRSELQLAGTEVSFMEEIHGEFMFPDLYPTVWERQTPSGLALTSCWQFKQDYMPESTVQGMIHDFQTVLAAMARNPGDCLSSCLD